MTTSLVWFRDDLRVRDNPALLAAVADAPAVALYVLDEESPGIRPLGGAARWWLHHALEDLCRELDGLGIPLLLRRGPAAGIVGEVAEALDAGAVYWNRRYGGPERQVDAEIKEESVEAGLHAESFQASLLHEPWQIRTGQGNPYKVFTPFWKTVAELDFRKPLCAPDPGQRFRGRLPESEDLDSWELLPRRPDWADGLRETWTPGAATGHELLEEFIDEALAAYPQGRDRPAAHGTSRLSPYLRWGHLSPFQIWHAVAARRTATNGEAVRTYLGELGWREFCWHQLYHQPLLAERNLRPEFDAFPWQRPGQRKRNNDGGGASPAALNKDGGASPGARNNDGGASPAARVRAWQRGRTGVPLVDAGQRELWTTGWMHNRVRMVSASFLVKNLGIDWRVGEQWFWDTLVDADPANNPASWQWVAGSGADAAPFFRIFNPLTQQAKFDPDARYVARWVPEYAGPDYPEPIVDVKESRQAALEAYQALRRDKAG
ncbi:cryptochrome/photolyase family protein [Arthrobacter sp. VKM Ac-2550]|uniref:cryptochrome/photolyase family protein n=1 Tax=Crystallibacter permensis TaxID=1938888 RepID=UPI002225FAF6|nr:deoxyribodipyrimidine photo-lyase [Arthrobacter sp. VKM Ac-2550]MCW2135172.1 deoxyribodipyrimidine photo-lyase type I [Arthrobacter sp. VKM Ac-2550]